MDEYNKKMEEATLKAKRHREELDKMLQTTIQLVDKMSASRLAIGTI